MGPALYGPPGGPKSPSSSYPPSDPITNAINALDRVNVTEVGLGVGAQGASVGVSIDTKTGDPSYNVGVTKLGSSIGVKVNPATGEVTPTLSIGPSIPGIGGITSNPANPTPNLKITAPVLKVGPLSVTVRVGVELKDPPPPEVFPNEYDELSKIDPVNFPPLPGYTQAQLQGRGGQPPVGPDLALSGGPTSPYSQPPTSDPRATASGGSYFNDLGGGSGVINNGGSAASTNDFRAPPAPTPAATKTAPSTSGTGPVGPFAPNTNNGGNGGVNNGGADSNNPAGSSQGRGGGPVTGGADRALGGGGSTAGTAARTGNDLNGPSSSPSSVTSHAARAGFPILLDISGTGIQLTELTSSNRFMDAEGSGLLHRTAWAGSGTGVLFYDPLNEGAIVRNDQYIFTDWDPTARGDLEALRNVFDSNGDGVFTAADAKFALFKIEVSNADGTTSVMTLAQAGITAINLKADLTHVQYADGSAITGQTTFTRVGGSTGTVANTSLASESVGYAVTKVVTTDASGNRVVTNTAFAADGSIAEVVKSVTSPSGNSVTTSFDVNGDGVWDKVQAIATTTVSGVKTETLTNRNGGNVLLDAKTTVTSADGKTITISRDSTGGGWFDQREVRVTNADASRSITITDLNPDGTAIRSETKALSINGLTRTVSTDLDSNGTADSIVTHALVVNADTSRTETTSETANNGALLGRTIFTTSANGKTQTSVSDLDGDADTDRTDTSVITVNADGSTNSVTTVTNGDATLRSRVTVAQSANSLSKTTTVDVNGDAVIDLTTTDVMVINADTSRVQTVSEFNTDGSLRDRMTTTIGADRVSKSVIVDQDGNGTTDESYVVTVDASSIRTATNSSFNADGSLIDRSVATTSANGLSTTTTYDRDGNAVTDLSVTDVTVFNANGTSTRTVSSLAGNGVMFGQDVTTTSANGLLVTTQSDIDGVGGFDFSQSNLKEVFADLSTRVTETTLNANGSLSSQSIMNASADRRNVTITQDQNGDGFVDQITTSVKAANGTSTDTSTSKARDGSTINQLQVVTSANGLSQTTNMDIDGNASFETVITDVTTLTVDGGSVDTIEIRNLNGSLRSKDVVTTSGNGLTQTSQVDRNGDGVFESITSSVAVLNADGSRTTTIASKNSLNAVTSQSTIIVSDDGLSTTLNTDINGDLVTDFKTTDVTVLNADGSTTETVQFRNANNSLRDSTVTVISDDGRSITVTSDVNGDGNSDQTITRIVATNGDKVTTSSNLGATGTLQSRSQSTVRDDGLVSTVQTDFNGDLTYDNKVTSTTLLNADGSRTTTVAERSANNSLIEGQVTSVNATGLTRSRTNDFNGDGTIDVTTTVTSALAADGTWTDITTVNNTNGSLRNKSTTVTSSDGNTVTTSTDINGNTINDQVTTRTVAANGDVKTVNNFYSTAGTFVGSTSLVISANGLRATTSRDFDGDGRLEKYSTDTTALNNDGSEARTINYYAGTNKLLGSETFYTSDDGFISVTSADSNGDGVLDYVDRDTTTIAADGSVTRTIVAHNGSNALLSNVISVTSANGLNSSTVADYNGDGGIDQTTTYVKQADSSSVTTTHVYRTISDLAEKSIFSVSADGRTETLQQDINGDGFIDRFMVRQVDLSGNLQITFWSVRPDGSVISRIIDDKTANGLTRVTSFDFNADNATDMTRTVTHAFDANGNDVMTFTETYGAGTLGFKEVSTRSANGFLNVTQYDLNGDGTFDEVRTDTLVLPTLGGRINTSTTLYPDGTLREKAISTVSADGRTSTYTYDKDGNGIADVVNTKEITPMGETVFTSLYLNISGAVIERVVTTTSADGLLTTVVRGGKPAETIERSSTSDGSR